MEIPLLKLPKGFFFEKCFQKDLNVSNPKHVLKSFPPVVENDLSLNLRRYFLIDAIAFNIEKYLKTSRKLNEDKIDF